MTETVLDEAARVTAVDRQERYGHPLDNHQNTADHWRLWLRRKYGVDVPLVAEDVCWMNVLQKISREANEPIRDNKVDTAGYARNVEAIEQERARRIQAEDR